MMQQSIHLYNISLNKRPTRQTEKKNTHQKFSPPFAIDVKKVRVRKCVCVCVCVLKSERRERKKVERERIDVVTPARKLFLFFLDLKN